MLFLVALAGLAAFACSVGLLWLGETSMMVRYPLSAAVGYLAFFAAIRLWLAYRRSTFNVDAFDLLELPGGPGGRGRPDPDLFAGGRSGGAGGGAQWGNAPSKSGGGGFDIFDADDAWIIPVIAIALCGLMGILYVIYTAPLLLAELVLDAALIGGMYRRIRQSERRHWVETAVSRTWIPALLVIVTVAVAGWALQRAVPGAVSIGDVFRNAA